MHTFTEYTGTEYLMIDVASNFGHDKMDFPDRIQWVKDNDHKLESLTGQAEEAPLFHAAVRAHRDAQAGRASGYPISLDAASSGLQILACLVECRKSALLCGVVPTGHREDAYTTLYKNMQARAGTTTKIQRADLKDAMMTAFYTSKAVPRKVFGEGKLLETFYQTLAEDTPGAWELNLALEKLWQPYALSHDWTLPDNFHCHIKVTDKVQNFVQFLGMPVPVERTVNQGTEEGRSIPANAIHSIDGMVVREMHRRCSFDRDQIIKVISALDGTGRRESRKDDRMVCRLWRHYEMSGFLSTRILDLLDRENMGHVDPMVIKQLLLTLPETPFQILSTHDCFRCLPNRANDMRRQYNIILSDIARSDLLEYIVSQICGAPVPVTKSGSIHQDILQADYALC